MSGKRQGPGIVGAHGELVDEDLQRRVSAFVRRVGMGKAKSLLGVGEPTLEAAREGGHLRRDTIARVRGALEREEAKRAHG